MRFQDGIQAQPQVLAESARSIRAGLAEVAPLSPQALVSLIGVGASEHAAVSAAATWRAAGVRTIAQSGSEFLVAALPVADVHVAISESGASVETITAIQQVQGRVVTVTNGPDSVLAGIAHELLPLGSGPDSPVYTTGYTATVQALGLLGEHWSGRHTNWDSLPAAVRSVLDESEIVVAAMREELNQAVMIDVVATHTSMSSAGEGALMLREGARAHTASHETQNYLHGPMEPLDSRSACVVIGSAREVQLAQDVAAIGATTLLITTRDDIASQGKLHVLRLPAMESPLAQAVLEILPIQVMVRQLAELRGLPVDGFRYRQQDTKVGETLAVASDVRP